MSKKKSAGKKREDNRENIAHGALAEEMKASDLESPPDPEETTAAYLDGDHDHFETATLETANAESEDAESEDAEVNSEIPTAKLEDAASPLFEDSASLQFDETASPLPEETASPLEIDPENVEEVNHSELAAYESVEIEEVEFVEEERLESILESMLFATDRPVSIPLMKQAFKGTQITTEKIKRCLDRLAVEYAGARRGISLEEVPGGFQLRTKIDNAEFLKKTVKPRSFKLSGPALEVLAIAAYKQPVVKIEIDQIRGVESGHLLRALMERGLVQFEGKSDLPGRPMQYGTTKKFLEIFSLRNLKELPTISQIDELLPEGIAAEEDSEKPKLGGITDSLAQNISSSYSEGEEELEKIQEQLSDIDTTTQFFEEEKLRQKNKRDEERAQGIREAMELSSVTHESIPEKDLRWLRRYEEAKSPPPQTIAAEPVTESIEESSVETAFQLTEDFTDESTEELTAEPANDVSAE